jgi:hypothetical protein
MTQSLLSEAVDHLLALGVLLDISGPPSDLQYEIAGEPLTEGDLVAKAFALGMAGAEQVQ